MARLGDVFIDAANLIRQKIPNIQFVIPAANDERKSQLLALLKQKELSGVTLLDGQSREAMAAADTVLLASGTATLEAMLLKKSMVVSYKLSALTAFFVFRMLKQPFVSLPNLLAGKELVPELLQDNATPEKLASACLKLLQSEDGLKGMQSEFLALHKGIRLNADQAAAEAIRELITAS